VARPPHSTTLPPLHQKSIGKVCCPGHLRSFIMARAATSS